MKVEYIHFFQRDYHWETKDKNVQRYNREKHKSPVSSQKYSRRSHYSITLVPLEHNTHLQIPGVTVISQNPVISLSPQVLNLEHLRCSVISEHV